MSDNTQLNHPRGMRRWLMSVLILLTAMACASTGAVAATGGVAAQDPGNADSAERCQQEGWTQLMGQDGTTFTNAGDCVAFAARGEVLVALNHAPSAVDDTATTDKNAAVLIDVLANDIDPDGDALGITITTQPEHGSATVQDGVVRYLPAAGFFGDDNLTYTITDGTWSDTATVDIMVYACTVIAVSPRLILNYITIQITIIITGWEPQGPSSGTATFSKDGTVVEVPVDYNMPLASRVPVTLIRHLLGGGIYDIGVQLSDGESTGTCRGLPDALTVVAN